MVENLQFLMVKYKLLFSLNKINLLVSIKL